MTNVKKVPDPKEDLDITYKGKQTKLSKLKKAEKDDIITTLLKEKEIVKKSIMTLLIYAGVVNDGV